MGKEPEPVTLCRVDAIGDPGSGGFGAIVDGRTVDLLVVRKAGRVFAYLNHCPHTGSPLDWLPGQFLSLDRTHIQCATHDALFRIEDGFCVSGPCSGAALQAIPVTIEGDWIVLQKTGGGVP